MRLSPKQRAIIGIPKPGHPYWNENNIEWFGARYPGINLDPYRQNLKKKDC